MIDHTSEPSATIDSTAPTQSMRCAIALRDFGTRNAPAIERADHDRHVHDEHRAPPEVVEQEAAGDRPERDRDAGDAGPDADRDRTLARVREHVGEDGERRGHDQRGADPHHRAGRDELTHVVRHRRRRRREAEDDEADGERALAAVAVTEGPEGEEQAGEHEGVGVDDPLEVADAGTELAHHRGQRDVDDRVVDDDHEHAHAQHRQRQPSRIAHRALGYAGCRSRRLGVLSRGWVRELGHQVGIPPAPRPLCTAQSL